MRCVMRQSHQNKRGLRCSAVLYRLARIVAFLGMLFLNG
jgi:hypothetical protein